jgi:hypothetical protein
MIVGLVWFHAHANSMNASTQSTQSTQSTHFGSAHGLEFPRAYVKTQSPIIATRVDKIPCGDDCMVNLHFGVHDKNSFMRQWAR